MEQLLGGLMKDVSVMLVTQYGVALVQRPVWRVNIVLRWVFAQIVQLEHIGPVQLKLPVVLLVLLVIRLHRLDLLLQPSAYQNKKKRDFKSRFFM